MFEPHHLLIELRPFVHLPPADIAHHMVDIFQPDRTGFVCGIPFFEAGQERACVIFAFHEDVHRFAIGMYSGHDHFAMFIFPGDRFKIRFGAPARCFLPRPRGIIHPEGHHLYTVAVLLHVVGHQ